MCTKCNCNPNWPVSNVFDGRYMVAPCYAWGHHSKCMCTINHQGWDPDNPDPENPYKKKSNPDKWIVISGVYNGN